MQKTVIITIVGILIVVGTVMLGNDKPNQDKTKQTTQRQSSVAGPVKEFTMTAKQWEFSPETITVDKGDTVRLNVTSVDVEHGIAIPDFNVSENLRPGRTVVIEFVADKVGQFSFFCNVYCGVDHGAMRGTLVVR